MGLVTVEVWDATDKQQNVENAGRAARLSVIVLENPVRDEQFNSATNSAIAPSGKQLLEIKLSLKYAGSRITANASVRFAIAQIPWLKTELQISP